MQDRDTAGSYTYSPCKQTKTRDDTKLVLLRQNRGLGETAPNLWLSAGYREHFSSYLLHSATCSCVLVRKRRDGPGKNYRYQPLLPAFAVSFGHHSIHVLAMNFS